MEYMPYGSIFQWGNDYNFIIKDIKKYAKTINLKPLISVHVLVKEKLFLRLKTSADLGILDV